MDSAGESFEAIRAALADRNNILTVKDLCELAGVSRSGYYNWVRSEKNRELREAKDRAAFEQILEAYRFRGYAKGVRGIHMRLLHMGIRMNVKKIRRLMRKYKLTCPIRKPNPYRRLQRSIRMGSAAENLVNREFESHGPRAILLTDITYIPLCGRFCYLSTILDACTKQVLAYAMSESLEVDFVLETVQLLVKHHGISLSKETVIHSDQGTHYTSLKFIQLVENSALRRSMSRRGNCWDNAPQESFFGHMKDELASEIPGWTSFEAAKASIDRWMDYYNNDRCQWDLAKLHCDLACVQSERKNFVRHGEIVFVTELIHGVSSCSLGWKRWMNSFAERTIPSSLSCWYRIRSQRVRRLISAYSRSLSVASICW